MITVPPDSQDTSADPTYDDVPMQTFLYSGDRIQSGKR
ncbi:hypothetical protein MPS_5151 [Mycobacterium pseudoshottsii JCM 15466]|nr:hypothetical protein MPS_5151 [Mycobacterium pseudoshottsii JCM 15466]